jgi:broad specificity phosphatase PhoE
MLELLLAHHGLSQGNLDRSLGPDTDLTELGRQEAAQLGDWLACQDYAFTALYCSPLRRARQTAEIINAHFGLEIVVDDDVRETEVAYLDVLPSRPSPFGRESHSPFADEYEQMRQRVLRATTGILDENSGGHVLVVAHAGTLGTMLCSVLDSHALLVHTDQAAVHSLRWREGRWVLEYLNRQECLLSDVRTA